MLAAPEHQEVKGLVKVTRRTLRTIEHSLMVHARVLKAYIHFALRYTTDHIFSVISIKDMINKDDKPTTSFKLGTGKKPLASHLCALFCPCFVWKDTAHVDKKALNMRHQVQKGF